jgi:hypothetical protein
MCAAVVLVLVAGVGLAEEKKGAKKGKAVLGKLVKCEGGKICVMVKDEKMEYAVTDETKFQIGKGKGEKPEVLTNKDEIKEKFKEGIVVALRLDEEGKTAISVTAVARKKKDQ